MAVPTWSVGQVLAAADVNTWFVPLVAQKPGDTARASNTTLTADPDLVIPVAASSTYELDAHIIYKGAAASGYLQWQMTAPAGAALGYSALYNITSGGVNGGPQVIPYSTSGVTSTQIAWTGGVGLSYTVQFKGQLAVAATSGNLTWLWSQNISNGTATTVQQNSYITLRRIA